MPHGRERDVDRLLRVKPQKSLSDCFICLVLKTACKYSLSFSLQIYCILHILSHKQKIPFSSQDSLQLTIQCYR